MAIFGTKRKKDASTSNSQATGSSSTPMDKGGKNLSELKSSTSEINSGMNQVNHDSLNTSTSSSPPRFQAPPSSQTNLDIQPFANQHTMLPAHNQLAPTSASSVLYPWSLRPLYVLPPSVLIPSADLNGTQQPSPSTWGSLSAPPFPRYGHSVNSIASSPTGDLYIFGGLVSNTVKNDLYVMGCAPTNPSQGGGSLTGSAGGLEVGLVETRGQIPGPRVGHASVGVGNVLIVWGGDTKSRPEDSQDDGLYLLNLSSKEWTRVTTTGPIPEGRYGHASAMVGSKFFVFGGQNDDGNFMNDLVWFDLQKLKLGQPRWNFVEYNDSDVRPPKRTGHTLVTHGDCLYVFGGTDGQYHYNDTWCYDTNTQIWVELSCIGYIPVPREGHAATLVDDVMYVFGGRGVDGKDLEDLAAFKITNQRWFMFQNMGPAPSGRSGHAMATWQKKVYVLGGESYTSQKSDNPSLVHVLDTEKIKYPAENVQQQSQIGIRKPSAQFTNPLSNRDPTALTSELEPRLSDGVEPFSHDQDQDHTMSSPTLKRKISQNSLADENAHDFLANGKPAQFDVDSTRDTEIMAPNRPARPGDDEVPSPSSNALSGISESSEVEVEALKARDVWMRVALGSAVNRGFVAVDQDQKRFLTVLPTASFESPEAKAVVQDLIKMKQDLAKAKMALSEQAHSVDERIAGASRARTAALQEASYYRVKLAAFESGSPIEVGQLDREHNRTLEVRLAESLSLKNSLEQRVAQLQEERDQLFNNNTSAQESKESAISRAATAEDLASRYLSNHTDLQRQFDRQSSTIQSQIQQIASLTSTTQQLAAENQHLLDRVTRAELSQAEALRTLEQTRLTLVAANIRNNEILSIWEDNQANSSHHQNRAELLATEVEAQKLSNRTALNKVLELERILKVTRDEHEATKLLAAGSLADFVAIHKGTEEASQDILLGVQVDKLRAMSAEVETLRNLHQDSTSTLENLHNELDRARVREIDLQTLVSQLQNEVSDHQTPIDEDIDRNQSNLDHQGKLLATLKAQEAAELKVNLLRNFLSDHGLSVNEDTLARESEDKDNLQQSVKEMQLKIETLEGELNERYGSKKALSTDEDTPELARNRLEGLQQKVTDSEVQITALNGEVARLSTSEDVTDSERANRAEDELDTLSIKHRHLESTHMKAVQYVKGTEKMLRRMKEEVTRYKERNEHLEEIASQAARPSTDELQAEVETLLLRIDQLSTSSSKATSENDHLLQQLTSLKVQYGKKLHDLEVDATLRVDELQDELSRLDSALDSANHDLDASIGRSERLESELHNVKASIPGMTDIKYNASTKDEVARLEEKLKLNNDTTHLLQLANDQLEQRCRTAEEKISVLLDHFEHFNDDENSHEETEYAQESSDLTQTSGVEHHERV